jgi:hypothetical protein
VGGTVLSRYLQGASTVTVVSRYLQGASTAGVLLHVLSLGGTSFIEEVPCVRVSASAHACVRARACVRVSVSVCVSVRVCAHACMRGSRGRACMRVSE